MALEVLSATSSNAFMTVAGAVPALPPILSGENPDLVALLVATHNGFLTLNTVIGKLLNKPCWPPASTAGWIRTRDAWAALYAQGARPANLPLAKKFVQTLEDWRALVRNVCRAQDGLQIDWGQGVTYVPTAEDILWLKRMVQAEVRPGAALSTRAADARRVAQTMLNWFGFAKRVGRYRGFSLTDAIRAYSEPMKPTAKQAGQLFAQARTAFRPEIEEAVRVALTRGPVSIPTGTVQWGAPGFNENDPSKILTYPGPGSNNLEINRYYAQRNSLTFPGYRVA